ncbi:MAG: hypothetical protein MUP64_06825, partial [Anaerolineae bacterium]|nr:hypothetical protein [Anaerolineae bacterium]
MKRTIALSTIVTVLVGVAIGVAGSIGGLLISPKLTGITSEFRCVDCHQLHGAINLDEVPFNSFVLLTGDVPEPRLISVNDILPYRYAGEAGLSLPDFLANNGVEDFKEVSLISTDGGIVTLERQYVSERSLLLPYLESIRFQDDGLHVSTWLKGINKIIVIGEELPIIIDGRATSMGRLLRENTLTVVSERSYPMYRSEEDGEVRKGEYSHLHTGAPIGDVVAHRDFATLTVT